ncbi:MAG: DUF4349 domain-containing protein [Bacteroidota bacterium]
MKNKRLKKSALYFIVGFCIFFSFRLLYGFYSYPEGEVYADQNQYYYYDYSISNPESFEFSRKNYASSKYEYKSQSATGSQISTVDQKYEKIASMSSSSSDFENDESKVRSQIEQNNSIIQYEQKSGLSGSRSLNLAIGVPPDNFDKIIDEIKKIGSIKSLNISKADKTNEYKELQAQRISLEKTRESLVALKSHNGSIEEMINLENQILSVEQQIQDLGVSLGDFDEVNEFCTIKMVLNESITVQKYSVPVIQRVKVALEWTVKYYGITVLIFFLITMILWVISIIYKSVCPVNENKIENKIDKK